MIIPRVRQNLDALSGDPSLQADQIPKEQWWLRLWNKILLEKPRTNYKYIELSPLAQLTDYIRGIFNQNRQPSKIRGSISDQSWASTTSQVLARDALPGARRSTSRQVLGTRTSSTKGRARPRTSIQGSAKPRWTPIYTKWQANAPSSHLVARSTRVSRGAKLWMLDLRKPVYTKSALCFWQYTQTGCYIVPPQELKKALLPVAFACWC